MSDPTMETGAASDAWGVAGNAEGEAKAKLGRPRKAAEEFATCLRNSAGQIVGHGERHCAGERIPTGFVERAVNRIVAKRFSKRRSMRWTPPRGAHLALQARTRVLERALRESGGGPGTARPLSPRPGHRRGGVAPPRRAVPRRGRVRRRPRRRRRGA